MIFLAAFVLLSPSPHNAQLRVPNEAITDTGLVKPQTFSPANRLLLLKSLSHDKALQSFPFDDASGKPIESTADSCGVVAVSSLA
jgi:hypothetical protein